MFIASIVADDRLALGSGHGLCVWPRPPKKSKGSLSVDLTPMGSAGQGRNGCMLRDCLGYGLTAGLRPIVVLWR
jgi:hypothetical protein